ncbi:caspase family protein [Myxococcaceae bacterium GXIMD 01537]
MTSRAVLLSLLLLAAPSALAETLRVAVVVGNNAGTGERPPLRYAETDAARFAQVLTELGGVASEDLLLLQGRGLAELKRALAVARERVNRWHQDPTTRVILTFYFSGHSDGQALELGRERLAFAELKEWLDGTAADVRVTLVDSCRSGALLAAKGGAPGPSFDVRLTDELNTTGQVLLTSSAADELALESRELRGSFFTHHLVSGLRGAADTSGDGRVTLAEAYPYAFERTVKDTAATLAGTQHPAYDYRLSGRGELVLAELNRPNALLELPEGFERALVLDVVRDQVLAELLPGSARRVAVRPGRYAVRLVRGQRLHVGRVEVAPGGTRAVTWEELTAKDVAPAVAKGAPAESTEAPALAWPGGATVFLGGGAQAGATSDADVLPGARVALRSAGPNGLTGAMDFATGGSTTRVTSALAWVGWHWGRPLGSIYARAGLEVGAGAIIQRAADGAGGWSGTGGGAVWAGLEVPLEGSLALGLEAQLPLLLLRREGATTASALPGAWLGLLVRP